MTINNIEVIARVCHEANRAWCEAHGDNSQYSWEEAEGWQRDSAIKGVEYAITNPDAPDSAQHDAWMADKLAQGWTYGPVKDAEAKTHPCLVLFEELPEMQQVKDRLFKSIVLSLAGPRSAACFGSWRLLVNVEDNLPRYTLEFVDGPTRFKTMAEAWDFISTFAQKP